MLGFNETERYKVKNIGSAEIQVLTIYHNEKTYQFEYIKRKNSYKNNTITLI
jgi:hypothetical protein